MPSLYFAEGLPYVLVNTVSVIMYTKLGFDIKDIAFWTSLLMFPWIIKPLWGPLIDLYWTKRKWVILMQVALAVAFGGVALSLQSDSRAVWWVGSLICLGIAAMLSATHDIAADGFYMVGLTERRQTAFVGIRATFYRTAMIFGQGILIIIAGLIEARTGPEPVVLQMHAVPKGQMVTPAAAQQPDGFIRSEPTVFTVEGGTTAALSLTLAEAPETTRVVTINRMFSSFWGSFFPFGPEQLVKVKSGDRLEFSAQNWNVPQKVIVEADAKLKQPATARFEATAGNIPLTWTGCFAAMSGVLLLFALLHSFVMPKPALDRGVGEARAPFAVALGVIALFVASLVGMYVALFYSLKWVLEAGIALLPANVTSGIAAFLKPQLYTFYCMIGIIVLVWLVFQLRIARRVFMKAFRETARTSGVAFDEVFISFFSKRGIGWMLAFLLLYRLGEAMLVKMAAPFLLQPRGQGGLGLTQAEYGLAYGTIGIVGMTIGGILGGLVASRSGLRRWIFWMCLAINLPDALYIYLAYARPDNFSIILGCVATEAFGYGFGFAAYMLYMLYVAGEGEHKTSHFAICTGFMALGMMLPGMISGAVQELSGWVNFFIIVCIATLPGFLLLPVIPLNPEFGKRADPAPAPMPAPTMEVS